MPVVGCVQALGVDGSEVGLVQGGLARGVELAGPPGAVRGEIELEVRSRGGVADKNFGDVVAPKFGSE